MESCLGVVKEISAYKVLAAVNWIIFAFALVLVVVSVLSINSYDGEAMFSTELYLYNLIFALLAFALVYAGCVGSNDPKERPNYLFCHWLIVSIILMFNLFTFMFFTIFFRETPVEIEIQNDESPLFTVFRNRYEKMYNDYIISSYIACCTGCQQNFNDLVCGFDISEEFEPRCPHSVEANTLGAQNLTSGVCLFTRGCSVEDIKEVTASFLGLGCIQTLTTVPSSRVGINTCSFFEYLGLVGSPLEERCGAGVPETYVKNFLNYFNDRFYRYSIPWVLFIFFLFCGWTASLFMILFNTAGRI